MKLFKKIALVAVGATMAVGVGISLGIQNFIETKAAEALAYSTGFESSEGFSVSTVYNNTTERVQGPTGGEWGTIMGTATTTAPLAGSQQIQLRSYVGNMTVGMAYPKFSFANLTRVTFYTRGYTAGSTMTVEYSLDNSTWAAMTLTGTYSTTASTIEAAMPSGLSGNQPTVYFRINHTLVNAANRMYIDTVQVYTEQAFGTLDHIAINTPASDTSFMVGETFSSSGLSLIGYDGADEETANSTIYYSGWTTNYDDHVFVSDDIGTGKTVTVTYSGKTTTYTIDVTAVPTAEFTLKLTGADDFVTTSYAANNGAHEKSSVDSLGTISYYTNQVMQNSSNPVIQMQSGTSYVYNTTSFVAIHSIVIRTGATAATYSNNVVIKEGTSVNPTSGSTITASVDGTTYTYTFSSDMGFFSIVNGGTTTYIDSIEVIPQVAYTAAVDWADDFLTATGAVCVADGSTNVGNLTTAWSGLASSYDGLSGDAQNYFFAYNDTAIANAKARYQYVYAKYSLTNFVTDYVGTLLYSSNEIGTIYSADRISTYFVLLVSLGATAIIAGFYFLKKKKEIK